MLVGDRMSRPVITVRPEMPVPDALNLMKKDHVRRFPVIDGRGKLVGIISEQDLINASASNATTLSVWELSYLLSKITIAQVMTRDVFTISEDTPIEEAARIMVAKKIGGLPVMRGEELVGIITETDLFKLFLELMGARFSGVRISFLLQNKPGKLNDITKDLHGIGANIISVGTFLGETSATSGVVLKLEGATMEQIQTAVAPHVIKIIDIRQTKAG